MNSLDTKINDVFPGCVVRKDLVKEVKGNAIVPSYVLEYLLGQYCATNDDATINAANFKFTNVQLSEQSPLLGHTSASASLRNKYASLVVAIQRGEEYLKPNGEVIFQPQDIVWLVGDPKVISELK